jgi:DNA primase
MIPQTFIQELLHRVDIVDVVERYVRLKRAGSNYVACCPFHSEKTPSFTVSQTKQFYHCFGCGAHGSAVGFLMEYSGLGFVEAVKDLAQSVGMAVPEIRGEPARQKAEEGENLHTVLLTAARFYRQCLKEAPRAIQYLKRRGLSGDIAKRYGIGYAPDGWQSLAGAFPDYNAKALAAAGLVKQSDEGRRYDLFRDRIMFPIVDVRGNVIGFGGRVLDSGEPKYLNSPETPVFEKGRELYGLYQARRAIRDAGRVLVVEGYMDVVALAQYGIGYAVATLGTATTGLHVQKLLRQSDDVVFCFDGDAAGRRAAWRALEVSLRELEDGKQVRFLFLPQGEDPDTYVRAHGKDGFEKLLEGAMPLSHFLLEELGSHVDASTPEGRAKLLQDAKPLVKQVTAPLLSLLLRKTLAERAGIAQEELDALFQIKSHPSPARASQRVAPRRANRLTGKLILRLMADPSLAQFADPDAIGIAAGLPDIEPDELKALIFQLQTLRRGEHVSSWSEYARSSEFESVFGRLEEHLLAFDAFRTDDLQTEFKEFWAGLLADIDKKHKLLELQRKSVVKI